MNGDNAAHSDEPRMTHVGLPQAQNIRMSSTCPCVEQAVAP